MPSSAFDDYIKTRLKFKKKGKALERRFAEWRRIWKQKGPVEFAHKILKREPKYGKKIELSEEQQRFLMDLGMYGVKFAILISGRGGGKSLLFAIYVAWRIFTHEFWGITVMGGSETQSAEENKYVKWWIVNSDDLAEFTATATKKTVETHCDSYAIFTPCSESAARGPHPKELIIDEQATGEKEGKGEIIESALGQVTSSTDIHIIKGSTAQFVFGDFLQTWDNAESMGYTKYHWALAKHISGEKDIYKVFHDKDPEMWISNCPWIPTENIRHLRKEYSDDKWLVEILGGISKSSGLVFSRDDIEYCTCTLCPDEGKPCIPYKEGHCLLIQKTMFMEGEDPSNIPKSTKKALEKVKLRVEGIDWGKTAPTCYTALGKWKNKVFVLHNEEKVGVSDDEKIDTGADVAKEFGIQVIRPDPREWSYCNALTKKGFAVHELFSFEGGDEKGNYLFTLRRLVERHNLRIPCKYKLLIDCLKAIAYDDRGKVIKKRDHHFDSLLYGASYYGEIQDDEKFWEDVSGKVTKEQRKAQASTEPDKVEHIEDWESWAKREKEKKDDGLDEEDDFPWGHGVDMW